MSKALQVIVVAVALVAGVVVGVKYSEQLKNHFSWMSESKDEEVALPDLSNEEIDGAAGGEVGQDVLTNSKEDAALEEVAAEPAKAAVKK